MLTCGRDEKLEEQLLAASEKLLDDEEPRVRLAAGECLGLLAKLQGLAVWTSCHASILDRIHRDYVSQPMPGSAPLLLSPAYERLLIQPKALPGCSLDLNQQALLNSVHELICALQTPPCYLYSSFASPLPILSERWSPSYLETLANQLRWH